MHCFLVMTQRVCRADRYVLANFNNFETQTCAFTDDRDFLPLPQLAAGPPAGTPEAPPGLPRALEDAEDVPSSVHVPVPHGAAKSVFAPPHPV